MSAQAQGNSRKRQGQQQQQQMTNKKAYNLNNDSSINNNLPTESSLTSKIRTKAVSISLGKPSLKYRMEAYYSLINPSILSSSNYSKWIENFDEIYNKYGGTINGEQKLANKLCKKYGGAVKLRVVSSDGNTTNTSGNTNTMKSNSDSLSQEVAHDESHYTLNNNESSSPCISTDVTSKKFNPIIALKLNENEFMKQFFSSNEKNNTTHNSTSSSNATIPYILDNITKFRFYLPNCDPQKLHRKPNNIKKDNDNEQSSSNSKQIVKQPNKNKPFAQIASMHIKGPYSILYKCFTQNIPIKIMIRYVDCIRGIITGTIIAFDKHCNLILRNAYEYYSPRMTNHMDIVRNNGVYSNYEVEVCRRSMLKKKNATSISSSPFSSSTHEYNKIVQQHQQPKKDESNNEFQKMLTTFTNNTTEQNDMNQKNDEAPQQQQQKSLHGKKRFFKQMLIRGDNVVMIWKA